MAIELVERFLARGYSPKWNVQDINIKNEKYSLKASGYTHKANKTKIL